MTFFHHQDHHTSSTSQHSLLVWDISDISYSGTYFGLNPFPNSAGGLRTYKVKNAQMTISANAAAQVVGVSDDDGYFKDGDGDQVLTQTTTLDGHTEHAGERFTPEYAYVIRPTGGTSADNITIYVSEFDGNNVVGIASDKPLAAGATYDFVSYLTSYPTVAYSSLVSAPVVTTDGIVDGADTGEVMAPGYVDAQGDEIDGADGLADIINGNAGNDTISGGADNDIIYGGNADTTTGPGTGTVADEGGYTLAAWDLSDVSWAGTLYNKNPFPNSTSGLSSFKVAGATFTIGAGSAPVAIGVHDHDTKFSDGDTGQTLVNNETVNGDFEHAGGRITPEYAYTVRPVGSSDPAQVVTIYVFEFGGNDSVGIVTDKPMVVGATYEFIEKVSDYPSVNYADLATTYLDPNLPGAPGGDVNTGDDVIDGNAGDDAIDGQDGNDLITGGAGADTMVGGADADTIVVSSASDAAGDVVDGGSTGNDNDTLDLRGAGPVSYTLTPDSDGNGFDGTVDILDPATGAVVETLGFTNIESFLDDGPYAPGPDGVVDGEDAAENMGAGYDDSNAPNDGGGDAITPNADVIDGNGGNDTIDALAGDDTVDGGNEDDLIDGNDGDDILYGNNGDDTVSGGAGDDEVWGDLPGAATGYDLLDGGAGADTIVGGSDADTILISSAPDAVGDVVDGGSAGDDDDLLDLTGAGPVAYRNVTPDSDGNGFDGIVDILDPNTGAVLASVPFTNIERFADDGPFAAGPDGVVDGEETGESMNFGYDDSNNPTDQGGDVIDNNPNVIEGNGGDDTINGAAGDDTISGGNDDDIINGGAGADVLNGNDDRDIFKASTAADAFGDVVDGGAGGVDFDVLDLTGLGPVTITNVVTDSNGNGTDGTINFQDPTDGSIIGTMTYSEIEQVKTDGPFVGGPNPDGVVDGEDTGEDMGVGYDDSNAPTDGGGDQITNGDDVIDGNGGDDTIDAGAGDDDIGGGTGYDLIEGGAGADTISGGRDADTIVADNASDADGDVVDGGSAGDDNDTLDLRGAGPVDYVLSTDSDGNGFDGVATLLDPTAGTPVATVTFTNIENFLDDGPFTGGPDGVVDGTDAGEDMLPGYTDADGDMVTGGSDVIEGNGGNDNIKGNGGDDVINGGDGKDTIDGGDGNDTINTGANEAGNLDEWEDVTLGNGADVLVLEAGNDYDRVQDFDVTEDQIDLSSYGFTDFSDVVALMTESTNRRGVDRIDVDLGGGDALRMIDVTIAELDAGNFIL